MMESFLNASKDCLANLSPYRKVRVVLGNETCDLDSAVCALVQGLFQYYDASKENCNDVAVIPVMNIPEKEFRIKTEVVYYLKRHKVPLSLLTFRDQIDLHSLNNENRLQLILVDHHILADKDLSLAESVVEIIDHRPQDAAWSWTGKTINLQTVGSCATLVARNILQKRPDIVDQQVSNLLRGPILVDTCNFSEEADRATPADFDVIHSLEELGPVDCERIEIYNEIITAKTDVSKLTPDDLIIRDLKVVNNIPIVGLPMLVKNFIKETGVYEAINSFVREKKYSLVILMGLDLNNNAVTRDIAVFSLSTANELENNIIRALTSSVNPGLDLTMTLRFSRRDYNFILYRQGNVQASRKQILPIVRGVSGR